jgi:ATP-dependent Lon protease
MSIENEVITLPLLPLRDVVVFPHMVIPLFVGREKSINALELAMTQDKQILLVAQKNATIDEPTLNDIYPIGTLATILQLLKLPDGTVKVLVEGSDRVEILSSKEEDECYIADVKYLKTDNISASQAQLLVKTTLSQFEQYVNLGKKIPGDVLTSVNSIEDPSRLADVIASHLPIPLDKKQSMLEITSVSIRLEQLIASMDAELDLIQVEKRIRGRVKKQMEKSQREYYLNEQMKAIQKELGDLDEAPNEMENFQNKINTSGMPKAVHEKASAELHKLKMMSPMSAEASVLRTYIDWLINVPWKKRSKVHMDLAKAEEVLNQDHYGLTDVKERILEYLAVQKRVKKSKGPVLCLVGPPGVGKTSLAESIAKATNRQYVRMALGGVRDEAEIRGHRRTYIGSMPGKLVQKISKVGVRNPLFLLDEIDKMGMDHRGDPASALLEVLDPEQNHTFNDHYLEVDYDLSEVMFICTSNSMNIPSPLLDRMEIIRIPGYTEDEKLNIAMRYLVPKQQKNNGLAKNEMEITEDAIRSIVRYYTREAGVRGLEREIAKISRKIVKASTLLKEKSPIVVNAENVEKYLGVRKFDYGLAEKESHVGLVTGLAWTQVGGELLSIEAAIVPGKGLHVKTGSLGDVMQESIQAAMTVVRSRAQALGIPVSFMQKHDLHIHVPEGATPKDGPSAGVGMCTAMVSVLTGIPVKADVAMTGEITLRGQVLRIGGLKEKLLAAHRGGIKTIIIPHDNERDLAEIPENILANLTIKPVKWIDEVLAVALETIPKSISDEEYMAGFDQKVHIDDTGALNKPSTH